MTSEKWEAFQAEIDRLTAERDRLQAAIVKHHAQKADDRCYMDDDRLYLAAGLPSADIHVGDKAAMLANCERFIKTRCMGGKWRSYAELEAALHTAKAHPDWSYIVVPANWFFTLGLTEAQIVSDGFERCPEAETPGSGDQCWRRRRT